MDQIIWILAVLIGLIALGNALVATKKPMDGDNDPYYDDPDNPT